MTILTRILRLFKADIHGVMDQLEDKELLIRQYLREMENSLQNKEVQLQQIDEKIRHNESTSATHHLEIEKIERDLLLALRKDKDDIAKMLIRRQRTRHMHCEQLQQQRQDLQKGKEQLSSLLGEQRLRYASLKAKANTFCNPSRQEDFNQPESIFSEPDSGIAINEEEIELEFIRRKENLQKGGDTA